MEYFDQFPGEDITPAGGVSSDPEKAEEELDEMLLERGIEQPAPRIQQEEQPAPEAEAPAAEAEAPHEESNPKRLDGSSSQELLLAGLLTW